MRNRFSLIPVSGLLMAAAVMSTSPAGSEAPETDLASLLPENSIDGLQTVLVAAMTGAESIKLRDLVEADFVGRTLISAAPKKLRLGGNATYRKERDFEKTEDELDDRIAYSLSLTKAIYHWGALEANRLRGDLSLEIEELTTFETYRVLALDVRRKYLAILVAKSDVDAARKSLEIRTSQFESEQDRLEAGTASGVQLYNAELRLNAAELELLKKENSYIDQIDSLARLVGIPPAELAAALPIEFPAPDFLSAESIAALENQFELGVSQSASIEKRERSIEFFEHDLHIANQRNKPKFGVSVGVSQFELDETGRNQAREILFGGFTVSWNVFDGGASKGTRTSIMAKVELVKKQYEIAKSDYLFDLKRTQNLLGLNQKILARDEALLLRAMENLEALKKDFELERATESNVENAEMSLATQEVRTNNSRSEYLNALVRMSSLLGHDPFAQKFIEMRNNREPRDLIRK